MNYGVLNGMLAKGAFRKKNKKKKKQAEVNILDASQFSYTPWPYEKKDPALHIVQADSKLVHPCF